MFRLLARAARAGAAQPAQVSPTVFTPAHRTLGGRDPAISSRSARSRSSRSRFPIKRISSKKAECTDCHERVEKGADRRHPQRESACMICHVFVIPHRPSAQCKQVTD